MRAISWLIIDVCLFLGIAKLYLKVGSLAKKGNGQNQIVYANLQKYVSEAYSLKVFKNSMLQT